MAKFPFEMHFADRSHAAAHVSLHFAKNFFLTKSTYLTGYKRLNQQLMQLTAVFNFFLIAAVVGFFGPKSSGFCDLLVSFWKL